MNNLTRGVLQMRFLRSMSMWRINAAAATAASQYKEASMGLLMKMSSEAAAPPKEQRPAPAEPAVASSASSCHRSGTLMHPNLDCGECSGPAYIYEGQRGNQNSVSSQISGASGSENKLLPMWPLICLIILL